jgi:hypothetical protein
MDRYFFALKVSDIETETASEVVKNLEQLAFKQGIAHL